MQEQTITALCAALTAQQLPFAQGEPLPPTRRLRSAARQPSGVRPGMRAVHRTLQLCRENGVRVYLLGNGSNTLFDDAGFDGAVIDMRGSVRDRETPALIRTRCASPPGPGRRWGGCAARRRRWA